MSKDKRKIKKFKTKLKNIIKEEEDTIRNFRMTNVTSFLKKPKSEKVITEYETTSSNEKNKTGKTFKKSKLELKETFTSKDVNSLESFQINNSPVKHIKTDQKLKKQKEVITVTNEKLKSKNIKQVKFQINECKDNINTIKRKGTPLNRKDCTLNINEIETKTISNKKDISSDKKYKKSITQKKLNFKDIDSESDENISYEKNEEEIRVSKSEFDSFGDNQEMCYYLQNGNLESIFKAKKSKKIDKNDTNSNSKNCFVVEEVGILSPSLNDIVTIHKNKKFKVKHLKNNNNFKMMKRNRIENSIGSLKKQKFSEQYNNYSREDCKKIISYLFDDLTLNDISDEEFFPFKKICGFVPEIPSEDHRFMEGLYMGKINFDFHRNKGNKKRLMKSASDEIEIEDLDDDVFIEEDSVYSNLEVTEKAHKRFSVKEKVKLSNQMLNEDSSEVEEMKHFMGNALELNNKVNFECFDVDDGQVILIKQNSIVYFHGLFTFTLLQGSIEVNGYSLCLEKEYEMFSPRGSSFLYMKNTSSKCKPNNTPNDLNSILYSLGFPYTEAQEFQVSEGDAVCYCKKLETPRIDFIEKHISQQLFPQNYYRFVFTEDAREWNVIKIPESWRNICKVENSIREESRLKILICGGKNVGKSTLLRYSCNQLLEKHPKVLIIDVDPGQPEFTISGCVSATIVTEPLFGPNYTHIKKPERNIFIPNINVTQCPVQYLKAVGELVKSCQDFDDIPVLINFMGITKGIGFELLSSVICLVKPDKVVEIFSKKNYKNFALTPECNEISKSCKMFLEDLEPDPYEICRVPSMSESNKGWELGPRQVREMLCLSYLSQILPEGVLSLTNERVPLYECNLKEISLIEGEKKVTPADVLAQLVALCTKIPTKEHFYYCHGWGIIRGIDASTNMLYIISPENMAEEIDHLVLGSVSIPPSIYMTPDKNLGIIPYVQLGTLTGFTQLSKRSFVPVRKYEENDEID